MVESPLERIKRICQNNDVADEEEFNALIDVTENNDLSGLFHFKEGMQVETLWDLQYEDENESGEYWITTKIKIKSKTEKHQLDVEDENSLCLPIFFCRVEDDDHDIKAVVLSKHLLYLIDTDETIPWRHEGSNYECTEECDMEEDEELDQIDEIIANKEEACKHRDDCMGTGDNCIYVPVCTKSQMESQIGKSLHWFFIRILKENEEELSKLQNYNHQLIAEFVLMLKRDVIERLTNYFTLRWAQNIDECVEIQRINEIYNQSKEYTFNEIKKNIINSMLQNGVSTY